MNTSLFFLDLEETIIRSFDNPVLCNVQKIKTFLEKNNVTEIGIFSYAIYSDKDQAVFESKIKPSIEEALNVKIISCPSVRDMIAADSALTGLRFDKSYDYEVAEYIQLRGKKDGFINYVNSVCGDFSRAVLIDDVVPDLTVTHRTKGWSIELWNVNSI